MKMPVVFVGHGSPMNIIERNRFTEGWIQMAAKLPKPRAIVCISAHWFTDGQSVSTAEQPETIYDFYGFPEELYQLTYPAPGAPATAGRVAGLLGPATGKESRRGLDHGAWSVLRFMFPQADIPVFQLSVNQLNSPQASYQAGGKLKPLRDEGVLILGSGDVVHNLQLVNWEMPNGYPWAESFDAYIKGALLAHNADEVINYERAGIREQKSFYYRDHFDPLLYCLGATEASDSVEVYNEATVLGALSMTSYLWQDSE